MNFIKKDNLASQIISQNDIQLNPTGWGMSIFTHKGIPYYLDYGNIISEGDLLETLKILGNEEFEAVPSHYYERDYYSDLFNEYNTEEIEEFETELIANFPQFWEIDNERIESTDNSKNFIFYASIQNEAEENETVEYSLVAPNSVKYKKLEFVFGQSAYKLFEGLNNVEIDFHFIDYSLVATPKSENIFIKIEQEISVPKDCLEIKLLNEIDNSNYDYDFSTEFTCQIENELIYFKIGNIEFEYEI